MIKLNENYGKINESYLFSEITRRTIEYKKNHPEKKVISLGVGDVSFPLCDAIINSLHDATNDQSKMETFHGYLDECGLPEFKTAVKKYYENFNVSLEENEIFATSGALNEISDILDLFSSDNTALITEPAYPGYIEATTLSGLNVIHLETLPEDNFVPTPKDNLKADIIYLCSPNNPTGTVYDKKALKSWVDFANENKSIIIFDAAYEAFISDNDIPHSIFEIEGSKTCAIEICSLSKTAGFTGMRCGYTIVPNELSYDGFSLNKMWSRNRMARTNGVSYVLQKAGIAALSQKGRKNCQNALDIYRKNALKIMDALDKSKIKYFGGENSPYIWLECPFNMDSWEFFDYLLNELNIVGTPGEGFGNCGKHYFRLSAFGNPEDTAIAADRIVKKFA